MSDVLRDGIPIEKGVVLTRQFLDANQELFTNYLNYWILYPDLFLDAIQASETREHFHLFFYQRIALRACMRYRYHYWTATRASSKSFTAYLAAFCRAVLLPGSNIFIASEVKGTVIKTAEAKFEQIQQIWPLLTRELTTRVDDGKTGEKKSGNYYELHFKNGSNITVVSKDTSRGLRANAGILEEAATIEETDYTEVLLPQMNVARREVDGSLNPEEPVSPQTFITTAREKTVYMYRKLIECAVTAVLRPQESFVWGISYEIGVRYGLISKQTMLDQRYSNNISEESFARKLLRESMVTQIQNLFKSWELLKPECLYGMKIETSFWMLHGANLKSNAMDNQRPYIIIWLNDYIVKRLNNRHPIRMKIQSYLM